MFQRLIDELKTKKMFIMFQDLLKLMKDVSMEKLKSISEESQSYDEKVMGPMETILASGEKISKDLHFRLKDNEKLGKLISRIEKNKAEYYRQCKEFESIHTEQIILLDIKNYYKNEQKTNFLKNELIGVHENLY